MPFKHYIQRIEGKTAEIEPSLRVVKDGSQYCVELPVHLVEERCSTLYPFTKGYVWGIWRSSKEEAIRAYETATDEQLHPASIIGGQLRYCSRGGEYV